jgi:GT2 family glycosyltransferase/glycosyltransferase involved in cell wall biosynthesis/SAM-dependent methyltransferase
VSGIPIIGETGSYADGSEDRLLDIIESAADRSSRSDELAASISDWPTRYHLSRVRANVIRPLQIRPGMRVLDVGAGTGVIARYLGELGADVVALEGALPRARVAAARCEELSNVQVICGQAADYHDDDGFDLVLVIGVLEYAAAATPSDDGALGFLAHLRSLIRPSGRIAIAIENQLGLKYLLAFSEDHLGEAGVGLEGYPGAAHARTFPRRRLGDLLTESGFAEQRWLYPFPDYKLTKTVLSDAAYGLADATDFIDAIVREPVRDLHRRPNILADDRAAHRVILEADLGPDVANSFLVVAGGEAAQLDDLVDPNTLAWLYGDERLRMWLRQRRIAVRGDQRVVAAEPGEAQARERGWLSQAVPDHEPYTAGTNLEQLALAACAEHDLDRLSEVLQSWVAYLEVQEEPAPAGIAHHPFLPEGTTRVLDGRFMDANLDNFVQDPEGIISFVDPEWIAHGGVTSQLAKTRGLWWLAKRLVTSGAEHPWSSLITPDELAVNLGNRCGVEIDAEALGTWRNAEAALQAKVLGADQEVSLEHFTRTGVTSRADHPVPKQLPYTKLRREVAELGTELRETNASLDAARSAEESTQQRLDETTTQLSGALRDVADLRRQIAAHTITEQQLQAEQRRVAALRTEAKEAAARASASQQTAAQQADQLRGQEASYQQLRNRRSVRTALSMAAVFRPLFRVFRGGRREQASPPAHGDTAAAPPEEPAPAHATAPAPVRITQPWVSVDVIDRPVEEPVTVVVPIYNAAEETAKCLAALVRNTEGPANLLLIDDASTDPAIGRLLERYGRLSNVEALRNDTNLGFVRTVNRGFEHSTGDVVILNSDVQVLPRWLTRMRFAARQHPQAATVTALSNNAGAFSAPVMGEENPVPLGYTRDEIGQLVGHAAKRHYPAGPTGNGFCMYVRREMLNEVGLFDADAFPRGYGEENDLCMRALRNGWTNIVDDATYVFHTRSASFSGEKYELMESGRTVLDDRYPEYTSLVRTFVSSPELEAARGDIADDFVEALAGRADVTARLLYVLHDSGGGTPATNRDLVSSLEPSYVGYVLTSNSRMMRLWRYVEGDMVEIEQWEFEQPIQPADISRDDYRRIVASVLVDYDIELVHIRHLLSHTFDIPSVARALGIPVVLSFHDFYYVCPTIHLLDNNDVFCGGVCTPGQGQCRLPTAWLESLPHLKHTWVYRWREYVWEMFDSVDAFVTASNSAKAVYLETYPELEKRRFEVIEHGRDLTPAEPPIGRAPAPGQPARILLPGNLAVHKGADLIREIKQLDTADRIEFHAIGYVPDEYQDAVTFHGPYDRHEFHDRARGIAPAFTGLFSTTAETYSHVLSESWAAGIPVLATDLGALQERVERHGGGWIVDSGDAASAFQRIIEIIDDPDEYERQRLRATVQGLRTQDEMASDYAYLYRRLLQDRRAFAADDRASAAGRAVLRVGLVVAGQDGLHPASVHVRTLRRLTHPSIADRVVVDLIDVDRFVRPVATQEIDLALVQRTALPPDAVQPFIETCAARGVPIAFDLDDDLLSLPRDSHEYDHYAPLLPGVEALIAAARLVIVSTPELQERARQLNPATVAVRNALDERLWFAGEISGDFAPHSRTNGSVDALYFGTTTHGRDLDMVRPALERIRAESGIDVRLSIIGGEPERANSSWFTRLPVPSGSSHYPSFVAWLRQISPQFAFGIAPLVADPFNACKSDLKYLEYAALGLPGIFSDVPAYDTVRNGETGLVVPNEVDAWIAALQRLAAEPDLGRSLVGNAREYVLEERLLSSQASAYLEHLLDAVS